jgi:hypothetical protein
MAVMLDCPDVKALSQFCAELLGKPVTYEADGVAMIGADADADAAERAALGLRATRLDGAGPDWRVYADPAGQPFCLVCPA